MARGHGRTLHPGPDDPFLGRGSRGVSETVSPYTVRPPDSYHLVGARPRSPEGDLMVKIRISLHVNVAACLFGIAAIISALA
mgnify:CR=1 FL=1